MVARDQSEAFNRSVTLIDPLYVDPLSLERASSTFNVLEPAAFTKPPKRAVMPLVQPADCLYHVLPSGRPALIGPPLT
ncbi:hypothetical protein GCM10022224_056220 [Nonomuraea antimicrobica]|uniref:Uncharacterized protein n=1 Tax=Nonomuraea antimicrobica TaxID=561173 RepID=A0ABP7C9H8_9ACTN